MSTSPAQFDGSRRLSTGAGEDSPPYGKPRRLDLLRQALRARHSSSRTEKTYVLWVRRLIFFNGVRHPAEMAEADINSSLTYLAVKEKVSASTQNQVLSALLFLYRHVIGREVGHLAKVIHIRKPARMPVVITGEEVKAGLDHLSCDTWLRPSLMYSAGLRLMECLRLRGQDIDLARNEILVRDGKGAKDPITLLPASLKAPLQEHPKRVTRMHKMDLADGWRRVLSPEALDRKYPNAPKERRWQWVCPRENRWKNTKNGSQGRHHLDKSLVQNTVREAVERVGLTKRSTCHTVRHPFATPRLEGGNKSGPSRNSWATTT